LAPQAITRSKNASANPAAPSAVPIEMDPGLDYRDRWINFVVRGGVQALE
jgi:hypothetical protein